MKWYMKIGKLKYICWFLSEIFIDDDLFVLVFFLQVFFYFEMDFILVFVILKKEVGCIWMLVIFFVVKQDLVFFGERMIKWVKRIFLSFWQAVLFEDFKYVQVCVYNDQIEKFIMEA